MLKRIEADGANRAQALEADAQSGGDPGSEVLPKRVLVAEDNIVGQQVARRYLEAIGCDVIIAEHGVAAVAACGGYDFGLVLMDLQMPKMDGIQATQEIRRQERPGRRVPIIALTAREASDELARCTSAGMDGLLTKPLELPRLRQALERFGMTRRPAELALPVAAGPRDSADSPVDLPTLRAKFSGDVEFVRRLCQTFVTSTGQCLEELDRAMAVGERTLLRQLAHKIKGGSSSVYAHRVAAIAAGIETDSAAAPLPELTAAVDALRRAFDEATRRIGAEFA